MKLRLVFTVLFTLLATTAFANSTKFAYIQTNFTSGELSPKMGGRVDFPKYFNGAKTLDNMLVYPQGGIVRRSGFEYIATVSTSNEQVRLLPFEFSTSQAYILEMGAHSIRFYMDGGQIQDAPTSGTKVLLHCNGNDASKVFPDDGETGHTINPQSDAQVDTTEPKHGSGAALFDGSNDLLDIDDHNDFHLDNIWTIDFWVMFNNRTSKQGFFSQFTHPSYVGLRYSADHKFVWTAGGSDYEMGTLDLADDTWHHIAVVQDTVLNLRVYVNGTYLGNSEATAGIWANLISGFMIGRTKYTVGSDAYLDGWIDEFRVTKGVALWKANFNAATASAINVGSPYIVETPYLTEDLSTIKYAQSADIMWLVHEDYKPRKLTRVGGHSSWTFTEYTPTSDLFTTSVSYPSAVAFFEERLCFGGTLDTPQGLFLSVSGDYNDMSPGAGDDADSIHVEIAADQVNTIRWLVPGKVLVVGTVGGEWRVGANSLEEPITPDNIAVRRETAYGSANVQGLTIGKEIVFVQKAGKSVREFGYTFDVDGYISHDLNVFADHILDSKIIAMAYQQTPYSVLWCVTEDGVLYSLTYQKDHEVVAWARHPIGGTDVDVKSVAVIPSDEEDEVWLSLSRTVSGVSTGRYHTIERMKSLFEGTDTTDAFFVDSGLTYSGSEATTISGLEHMVSATVQVLADGVPVADEVVNANGEIVISTASDVCVGYGYNSNIETLRVAVPSERGTIQSKIKRISNVTLRFLESLECKIGPDSSDLVSMDFDDGNTAYSGDKSILFDGDYETGGYIYIRQDEPLPMTILSIIPEVRVSD